MAQYGSKQVGKLLQDTGIIRHRGKIEATINNAQRALEIEEEFGSLGAFFWQYEPKNRRAALKNRADARFHTTCDEAVQMSKALKMRGWTFVGPTTAYAFMESMGMVNNHVHKCTCYEWVQDLRSDFERPCS